MKHHFLLLIFLGSSIFSTTSGLSLASKNAFITTEEFSLVCTINGPLTTSVLINDQSGTNVGSCIPPPVGCGSGLQNTLVSNTIGETTMVTINILQSNINIPTSEGNWSCSNGTDEVYFPVKIYSITTPKVWTDADPIITGSQVNVEIDCIYPYPDEIRIDYKDNSTGNLLKSTTGLIITNGTASNCEVTDPRAISMKGSFTLSKDNLDINAKVILAAVVVVNGDTLGSGYSNFTFESIYAGSDGLSGGVIAGIVIGCLAFIAIVGGVIFYFLYKRN